jgi:hypothetical protein
MKQFLRYSLILTMAASGFMFAACQGEDGEPGPTGAQGEKGDKGDTGATGEDGIGFEEALQYGSITVQFKGIGPDNVAFDKTLDFDFCPPGPEAIRSSGIEQSEDAAFITLARYSGVKISDWRNYGTRNLVTFAFNKRATNEASSLQVGISVGLTTSDAKFFKISNNVDFAVSDENITGYSFNAVTGDLKFKFHDVLASEDNETGHDLEIIADINVKALQNLGGPK